MDIDADDNGGRPQKLPIDSIIADYLRLMWANKTPEEAYDILSKPDVTVTNQSDKDGQLPKIQKLAEQVRKVMQDRAQAEITILPGTDAKKAQAEGDVEVTALDYDV